MYRGEAQDNWGYAHGCGDGLVFSHFVDEVEAFFPVFSANSAAEFVDFFLAGQEADAVKHGV